MSMPMVASATAMATWSPACDIENSGGSPPRSGSRMAGLPCAPPQPGHGCRRKATFRGGQPSEEPRTLRSAQWAKA